MAGGGSVSTEVTPVSHIPMYSQQENSEIVGQFGGGS